MGFLLWFVSIIAKLILYPIAFITTFIKEFYHTHFDRALAKVNKQFMDIAVSNDATGNVVCDDLFNLIMIKAGSYQFGNRKETISSVFGKNLQNGTLTWFGNIIVLLLTKKHCIDSIDNLV